MNRNPIFNLLAAILLCYCIPVQAGYEGMSEEQMQQMMEQAQKMQECMGKIDQSAMDDLAARGKEMEKKIEMLCKAGKRSEAEDVAIKYGREIADSKEMKELQKCGDMARQMMADMPQVPDNTEHENRHICDGY